jgi:hypothetical protein
VIAVVAAAAEKETGLGGLGALVVFGLIGVSIGLFIAMRRSLGKVDFEEKSDPREDQP